MSGFDRVLAQAAAQLGQQQLFNQAMMPPQVFTQQGSPELDMLRQLQMQQGQLTGTPPILSPLYAMPQAPVRKAPPDPFGMMGSTTNMGKGMPRAGFNPFVNGGIYGNSTQQQQPTQPQGLPNGGSIPYDGA